MILKLACHVQSQQGTPLWSRGNIVIFHAAGPSSIPGRVNFLVEIFPGFSLTVRQISGNLGRIRPRFSYGHHLSSKPYIISQRTATISDYSCSTWPSLNNKQQCQLVRRRYSRHQQYPRTHLPVRGWAPIRIPVISHSGHILPQMMCTNSQSPMEQQIVHTPLRSPPTGMIIERRCAKTTIFPNYE